MTRENKFRADTVGVAQVSRPVELTIKGDVEVLRLQPGDTIVVTVYERFDELMGAGDLYDLIRHRFPKQEVIVVDGSSLSLSVQRSEE